MKTTEIKFRKSGLNYKRVLSFSILIFALLVLSSCQKEYFGYDGFDGRAYLALSWSEAEPEYIDVGTNAIPSIFYWDEYYRMSPGIYTLYYDGTYWDGYGWVSYAWEVDYEIWINYGEPGRLYHNGRDGTDTYFTLDCNPFGPYVYLDYKSNPVDQDFKLIEEDESKIVILKEKTDFSMKITYRKTNIQNHK